MLNNKYPIYYKQWRDYFDYLEVSLVVPEITFGTVGLSTRLRNEAFSTYGDQKSFFFNFSTRIGVEYSSLAKEINFVIFGFGIVATRTSSY